MGDFKGHFYECIGFSLLGLWWLFNMIINYIKSQKEGKPYITQLSYTLNIRGRTIPVEIIAKLGFFAGGSLANAVAVKFEFINDKGEFIYLDILQHVVFLGIAFLHAVSDLLDYLGLCKNKDIKFATASFAYAWNGAALYSHSDPMTGKSPLELILHRLVVPLLFSMALIWAVEIFKRDWLTIQMIRSVIVLTMGTWFGFTAFIMWGPEPDRWDRDSERNVHFVRIAFGIHLLVNMLIIWIPFCVVDSYQKYKKLGRCTCVPMDGRRGNGGYVDGYERVKLLEEEYPGCGENGH